MLRIMPQIAYFDLHKQLGSCKLVFLPLKLAICPSRTSVNNKTEYLVALRVDRKEGN